MKTVKQVSQMAGISVRTLHYYDSIGLLRPAQVTESGYRLYDDAALVRLQCILLFRQLQFPLCEIKEILDSPSFDYIRALEQQIVLLQLQKERIQKLIDLARQIHTIGVNPLDFSPFDTQALEDYAAQAKTLWGATDAYREFERKTQGRTSEESAQAASALMEIFREFGAIRTGSPDAFAAQALVAKLRLQISQGYYTCTPEILRSLGTMYASGGSMTENIDAAGGPGTAAFAAKAIAVYCETAS